MIQYLTYHEILEPAPFLPVDQIDKGEFSELQALAFPTKRHYFTGISQC